MSTPPLIDIMSQQKPRHYWSVEDRRLLCVLSRLYDNGMPDIAAIMNFVLAKDLKAEGFTAAMPTATLHAQLNHIQRQGSTGSNVWLEIFSDLSISEVRTKYRGLRDQIEDSALSLGIPLHLKGEDVRALKPNGQATVKRGRTNRKVEGVLPSYVSSEDDTDGGIRRSQSQRRLSSSGKDSYLTPRRKQKHHLPTPNTSRSRGPSPGSGRWSKLSGGKATPVWQHVDELGNKTRRFPRLVYRWYSRQSQGLNTGNEIRAGKFIEKNITIPPPSWNVEAVTNHLLPERILSPYISFRESLLSCVFYALKADPDDNASIAVIDLTKVHAAAAASSQWADDVMKPCPILVKKFDLKLGQKEDYIGRGEWLIYGKVDAEAIVTTTPISDLLQFARHTTVIGRILQLEKIGKHSSTIFLQKELKKSAQAMTYQTGRAVGLLSAFMRIPQSPRKLREQFAAKFATAWRLCGFDKPKPNKAYEDFMNGVYSVEGNGDHPQGSEEDKVKGGMTDDEDEEDIPKHAIEVKRAQSMRRRLNADDQDLIDSQLQNELSFSLNHSSSALEVSTTSSDEQDEPPTRVNRSRRHTSSSNETCHTPQPSSLAKPRDSSIFTFSRPHIPGKPTNWEATTDTDDSRDVSLTPTEKSGLDTFTAELLAKAEECSTLDSFGREPSITTLRPVVRSVVEELGKGESVVRGVAAEEGPVVISDDESEGNVEELDFMILGSRKIGG